jgi:hypothetical protein
MRWVGVEGRHWEMGALLLNLLDRINPRCNVPTMPAGRTAARLARQQEGRHGRKCCGRIKSSKMKARQPRHISTISPISCDWRVGVPGLETDCGWSLRGTPLGSSWPGSGELQANPGSCELNCGSPLLCCGVVL